MNPTNAEIRQFILDAFSDEDFEVFCADYFRDAQAEFSSSLSLRIKAQRLIEYCQNRGWLDNLLAALRQERPQRYAQRFTPVTPATPTATAPAAAAQPIARNPRQIFISHAHEDAAFAHRLASDLQQRGWPVWIAPDSVHPGEKWVSAINRGLQESGVFLAVITPRAVASGWVTSETDAAIELEHEGALRLIPLQVQPCNVSPLLRPYQRISFVQRYENGLVALLAALNPNLLIIESPFHLEWVRVPAGEFLMGSDPARDRDAQEDEQPQHRVYVSAFYIGKVPITNAQYAAYARAMGRENKAGSPSNKDDHPVVNVTWQEATDFCDWLSQATGQSFRLPTEAEWEKAARGTDSRIYPWGDEWDEKRLNGGEGGKKDTTPVGQYSPAGDSLYGVADMAGNVFEWVADWFGEDEYKDHTRLNSPVKDPTGPANGARRVFRGGSWYYEQFSARAAYRDRGDPDGRYFDVGFRVVLGDAQIR
ncbi:MAG: SUMF1/EgtB/PvdO family nonheme iron enzyme [Chloroflexi bacterium]|nr:SUMF1/EgtB/PvdO family nonheme iron enzyme [Chloroflexota bacterium]